jgi:hypothetical protein
MVSFLREPALHLGVRASDVMQTFYKALQASQRLNLTDLLTSGGNSYADLKLTINTFRGRGRIDITPNGVLVELGDALRDIGHATVVEHLELCENTLRNAVNGLEISERHLRDHLWIACDGGSPAVETFLGEKGNAALKLDQGAYAGLKKEFTLRFIGLDMSRATRIGLTLERSRIDGDLFVQFEHMNYGVPGVTQTVRQQFEEAERELRSVMLHVGLEPRSDNAGPA